MQNFKQTLLESLVHEYHVLEHLFGKLPEGLLDWRPQEKMRSTRELLQYLSYIGSASVELWIAGGWSEEKPKAGMQERSAAAKQFDVAQFPQAMRDEKARIEKAFASLSDDDFEKEIGVFFGKRAPLGKALMSDTLKYITAYRMQLFLYARMNGAEIGTANNWNGIDGKPKAA